MAEEKAFLTGRRVGIATCSYEFYCKMLEVVPNELRSAYEGLLIAITSDPLDYDDINKWINRFRRIEKQKFGKHFNI